MQLPTKQAECLRLGLGGSEVELILSPLNELLATSITSKSLRSLLNLPANT